MNRSVTIKTVSEKSGVSITVVSRVLNGKAKEYRISDATVERVKRVAEELQYVPSTLARGFRLRKTFTLGLIFPTIKNPFFAEMSSLLIKAAKQKGYFILLAEGEEDPLVERAAVDMLISRGIEGLFMFPGSKDYDYLNTLYLNKFPVVFIDRNAERLKVPYVGADHYQGAVKATKYLIAKGHRKIACIQGTRHAASTKARLKGFDDVMEATPGTQKWMVGSSSTIQNGYIQTKRLLAESIQPTAIFAMDNPITFGVIKAIKEAGLRIPEDISLISFEDQELLSHITPSITALGAPKTAVIEMALNTIIAQIEGKRIAQKKLEFPVTLYERDSVKSLKS